MFKLGCSFNGVYNHVLQRLQILCSYSTASSLSKVDNSSTLVNYLINSLGFSKQQSVSNYTKIAKYVGSKNASDSYTGFFRNADSVIHFFKQHNFELFHIRKLVRYYPPILSAVVDKTLKPKIKILQELGLSGSDVVHAIVASPGILKIRLTPPIKVLRAVLGSDENVVLFLKKLRGSIRSHITKYLAPNVKLLVNYGIPKERIQQLVLQRPGISVKRTELLLKIMIRVEQELGVPRGSKMFLTIVEVLSHYSDKCVELKIEVFKSFGWTRSDAMALIRKQPFILNLSEANIKNKLKFFTNELGYDPAYFLSHRPLLYYSLEKRLLPRYKVLLFLKGKGLIRMYYPLDHTFQMSESKFVKKIVLPYTEVHEVYTELTGGTLLKDAISGTNI